MVRHSRVRIRICLANNVAYGPRCSEPSRASNYGKEFLVLRKQKYFNIVPTEEQLLTLSKSHFPMPHLGSAARRICLFRYFRFLPMCVRKQRIILPFRWFVTEDFAKRGDASWQLVRKTPFEFLNVPMSDQLILMNDNEDVPSARIMVYAIIGYFCLPANVFEQTNVRCSDIDLTDFRVVGPLIARD